jgi:hypothetical protein
MTTHDSLKARLQQWSIDGTADFKRAFGVAPGRWRQMEKQDISHHSRFAIVSRS